MLNEFDIISTITEYIFWEIKMNRVIWYEEKYINIKWFFYFFGK